MKKITAILLVIFLVSTFQSQEIRITDSNSLSKNFQEIICQEKKLEGNKDRISEFLRPLKDHQNLEYQILYHILMAESFAHQKDEINFESDDHFAKAVKKAEKLNNDAMMAWLQLRFTSYIYKYRYYNEAIPHLLHAIHLVEKIPEKKLILPAETYKSIGYMLQTFQSYQQAIFYLEKARSLENPKSSSYAGITDNLGLNYLFAGNLNKAKSLFDRALLNSAYNKDFERMAKVLGNMAKLEEKLGNIDRAIELLIKDIHYSEMVKNDQNTMFACTTLANLYVDKNDLQKANFYLAKAETIALSKKYFASSELNILQLKLKILNQQDRPQEELLVRRKITELENSIKDGNETVRKINWEIEKDTYQQETVKKDLKIDKESQTKNLTILFSFGIILISMLVFFYFRRKLRKRKLLFEKFIASHEKDKESFAEELENTNESFNAQIKYLKNNIQEIQKILRDIEDLSQLPSALDDQGKSGLPALLKTHLMTDENWQNFKSQFKKEHPHFYSTLITEFPELTESNQRVILLQKLGFNNTEISKLLGITPDAVKKSKQRLRKKLGKKFDDFSDIISL